MGMKQQLDRERQPSAEVIIELSETRSIKSKAENPETPKKSNNLNTAQGLFQVSKSHNKALTTLTKSFAFGGSVDMSHMSP